MERRGLEFSHILVDTAPVIALLRGDRPVKAALISRSLTIYYTRTTRKELFARTSAGQMRREKRAISDLLRLWRLINPDIQVLDLYDQLLNEYRQLENHLPDAMIAATALAKRLPLFTFNHRHFNFISELRVLTLDEVLQLTGVEV